VIGLPLAAAAAIPGELRSRPGVTEVTGITIDSRLARAGDLFVAIGHGREYVEDALARGAAATLVPDDPFAALGALGGAVRSRSAARFVGITGSTGKTSTKDILAAICSPSLRTVANEANLNNEIGVPQTLFRVEPDTEVCILELAMRGEGQIAELCAFARPDVGVVTNVGPAHVELLGSIDAVVRAKAELVESLPPGGTAIVPFDFPVGRDDIEVVRVVEPETRSADGWTTLAFEGREIAFDFTARHQARNALFALHAARAIGVEAPSRVTVEFSRWRGDEVPLPGGGLLINDAYNANPLSMRAALEHLVDAADGRRTVAVLGDMAELGAESPRYHEEVGRSAVDLGVDVVVGVGELARLYDPEMWAPDAESAIEVVRGAVRPGDCVLVKASRAAGLEVVAEALATVSA
jgi:UDP-N-acetylmuramoyl-tripeptide--D-alanyl-D-alanine ligase